MRIGDLVKVGPSFDGTFLIVGHQPNRECSEMGHMWDLYSADEGWVLPMYEKWIVIINESR